jgi:acid phosphatase type 7
MSLWRRPLLVVTVAALAGVGLSGCASRPSGGALAVQRGGAAAVTLDPVIATAGDIACAPGNATSASACREASTAQLIEVLDPTAVLALGDNQYDEGQLGSYRKSYGTTWGQVLSITHPVPGNHEYESGNANGYFQYFGGRAGTPSVPYYSFDLGAWHLIALDGECSYIGGCGAGSPEERWLARDLATHHNVCTLAYWHEPRFSSGEHGSDATYQAFWTDLYAANADVVLNGHDHDYERFAPQTPTGVADPQRGIREFVVGTGGKSQRPFRKIRPNSQVRADGFGVLELTLQPTSYAWRFLPVAGASNGDSGSADCH